MAASTDHPAAKPHAVCLPCPSQSHITATLKLAKLLHWKGFHVTFVNTEFNHGRMVRAAAAGGPGFLDSLPPDFQFMTIPDGLPPSDSNATQDVGSLCESIRNVMGAPFADLVGGLNKRAAHDPNLPAVSCIVADSLMLVPAVPAGEKFNVPVIHFWPLSASFVMCLMQYSELFAKGFTPTKDDDDSSSDYLATTVDWIPSLKHMRLRDFPHFLRNNPADESIGDLAMEVMKISDRAAVTVINTFDALEQDVLSALSSVLPMPVHAIGPLSLLIGQIPKEENRTENVTGNLWEEDNECLQWLDSKEPDSVIYVNFGSIAFLSPQQACELAMGIANSNCPFLWIIRPDLVRGDAAVLPPEFADKVKGRGFTTEWCTQEEVLNHPSIGGFLTHCGWNSMIESMSAGIPMLCWPSFGDQRSNCRSACTQWESGLEVGSNDVRRDEIARVVRELMVGEKGKKLKERAKEWKKLAKEATAGPFSSSSKDLDRLVTSIKSI